ncbi:MAG: site-2 protease family protein [Vicinamibacterales bacterium]
MGWSYRIASFRGIELKLHATFLFVVLMVVANWGAAGATGLAYGFGLMTLLFGCVALHEFGHALAARYFGLPVREIVLLPIGGVALLGRPTRNAVQELVIAAAGPAVNVVIIALLAPLLWLIGEPVTMPGSLMRPDGAVPSLAAAVHWLLGVNISLVLFNLLPAFPMDGGRILRGLLGLWLDWRVATRWAARTGQVMAGAMGLWALFTGHVMLGIIAIMVFFAAASAESEERAHGTLSGRRTVDACTRTPIVLADADRVETAVSHLLSSYQTDFAVMRGGDVLGVIERTDILIAIANGGHSQTVADIMRMPVRVQADDSLSNTRQRLLDAEVQVAAVYRGQTFAGLINLTDIEEAEAIFSLMDRRIDMPTRRPPEPRRRVALEA